MALPVVLQFHARHYYFKRFLVPNLGLGTKVSSDQYFQTKKQFERLVPKLSLGTRVKFLKL